jgi:hypothetical protein
MERVHRTWLREAREEGMGGEGGKRSAFEDMGRRKGHTRKKDNKIKK